jgi:GntR family transcriptional regulator
MHVSATISARIAEGVYPAGSKLPSESQFCAEFGVSPMTLRKGLALLIDQGIVATEKGRGTFVRSIALADTVFRLEQLNSAWKGDEAEVTLLEAATVKADGQVAEKLNIPLGHRVVYLRRLVEQLGIPLMYQLEYVVFDARRPLVESQLQLTTLDGVLEAARGRGFPRGRVTLKAVCLDESAASILRVPTGSPALCLEHIFEDRDHQPMSWGWFLMHSELFQLTAQLGPD